MSRKVLVAVFVGVAVALAIGVTTISKSSDSNAVIAANTVSTSRTVSWAQPRWYRDEVEVERQLQGVTEFLEDTPDPLSTDADQIADTLNRAFDRSDDFDFETSLQNDDNDLWTAWGIPEELDQVRPWFEQRAITSEAAMFREMKIYAKTYNERVNENVVSLFSSLSFFADSLLLSSALDWQYSETGENCESFAMWLTWADEGTREQLEPEFYASEDASRLAVAQSTWVLEYFQNYADTFGTTIRCLDDLPRSSTRD